MIQRHKLVSSGLEECANGDWVRYSDVVALEQRVQELAAAKTAADLELIESRRRIDELEAERQWTPINGSRKELRHLGRLGQFLVMDSERYYYLARVHEGCVIDCADGLEMYELSAWMPLPKPYKITSAVEKL